MLWFPERESPIAFQKDCASFYHQLLRLHRQKEVKHWRTCTTRTQIYELVKGDPFPQPLNKLSASKKLAKCTLAHSSGQPQQAEALAKVRGSRQPHPSRYPLREQKNHLSGNFFSLWFTNEFFKMTLYSSESHNTLHSFHPTSMRKR